MATYTFNWKVTIFSVVCLVTFLRLGFWQLDRAEQKRTMMADQQALFNSGKRLLVELVGDPANGTPVVLEGEYQKEVLLLDNVVLDGVVGFEVLMQFRDELSGSLVLVNRGFVPIHRTRDNWPEIPPLMTNTQALGNIYRPDQGWKILSQESIGADRIVQSADPVRLAELLQESVYPYLIRLAETDRNALPRYWPMTTILPEKHTGYAIQWFCMAFAVGVIFVYFTIRTTGDRNE